MLLIVTIQKRQAMVVFFGGGCRIRYLHWPDIICISTSLEIAIQNVLLEDFECTSMNMYLFDFIIFTTNCNFAV